MMETKQVTVEQMNRVIADFMDYLQLNQKKESPYLYAMRHAYDNGHLKYHSDWNWLMPVVEKISRMPLLNVDNTPCTDYIDTCHPITFNMPTEDGRVMFRFKGFALHEADKLIDAVYAAVYEVAEYEQRKTKQP